MGKKKVFLTGGNGFVGKNIVGQLEDKYDFFAPAHSELDLTDADAVLDYMKRLKPDAVIHAANIGGNRKNANAGNSVKTNLSMFFNIARCSGHYGKLIQLGSGAEYDHTKEIKQVSEDDFDKAVPSDDYGFYKYACSKYIEQAKGITCIRIFGCFGKYEDYEVRFISNAICRSIIGEPIVIANRNARFSYIYVNDLVRIIDHFISNDGKFKFYNAVPDETHDLLSIAEKIREITGNPAEIIVKNGGMAPEYTGKNNRLRSEIPGFEFTPIDAAITEMYQMYLENAGKLDKAKLASPR